ncbi:SDR family NAD(P)-dependent oxidoreductase [Brevibacillus thermoruber]|uniref:SDR family NAD(P)-dependent oxidoreductase n=1 Tax=Brevibacillus thermoruber TaxID=33942 RepID=UPI004042A1A8
MFVRKRRLVVITGVTRGLGRAMLERFDEAGWTVAGVANVIRALVPAMVERGSGVIVNISSEWGRFGEALLAPYCASKFAVEGLTQSLARELPEGMAAVALDPGGSIDTAMLRACAPEEVDSSPTPEEWSRTAVPFILPLGPRDNGKSLTCPRP